MTARSDPPDRGLHAEEVVRLRAIVTVWMYAGSTARALITHTERRVTKGTSAAVDAEELLGNYAIDLARRT
jgi:hypothetical protein